MKLPQSSYFWDFLAIGLALKQQQKTITTKKKKKKSKQIAKANQKEIEYFLNSEMSPTVLKAEIRGENNQRPLTSPQYTIIHHFIACKTFKNADCFAMCNKVSL